MSKKFLRRVSGQFSKLGRKRKKKQVWRRPTGRDNKMREKRNGRPPVVSIGYKSPKTEVGLIKGKKPIMISNEKDLRNIQNNNIGIIKNVGKKKRLVIIKKAEEMKVEIYNSGQKYSMKENKK